LTDSPPAHPGMGGIIISIRHPSLLRNRTAQTLFGRITKSIVSLLGGEK